MQLKNYLQNMSLSEQTKTTQTQQDMTEQKTKKAKSRLQPTKHEETDRNHEL